MKIKKNMDNICYRFKPFNIAVIEHKSENSFSLNARSGHRIVCDNDGNVYSYGGYNPDVQLGSEGPLLYELLKFNVYKNTWTRIEIESMPEQAASHCLELIDGKFLLLYGGTGLPFEIKASNKIHLCDMTQKKKKWQRISIKNLDPYNVPEKMYGQAICYKQDLSLMYVIGGTTGFDYSNSVHCFNFESNKWFRIVPETEEMTEGSYRHEIALYEDKIYVFGGGSYGEISLGLKSLPVFDIKQQKWIRVQTIGDESVSWKFPSNRKCHSIVRYKNFVYIIGGLSDKGICHDVWQFNITTLKWRLIIKRLPMSIYFHSSTVTKDGLVVIFGGVSHFRGSRIRINKVFTFYIDIPPLKELALNAAIHYFTPKKLLELSKDPESLFFLTPDQTKKLS